MSGFGAYCIFLLSFFLLIAGFYVGFAMPWSTVVKITVLGETYTITTTFCGHPVGFVLIGIAFSVLIGGLVHEHAASSVKEES